MCKHTYFENSINNRKKKNLFFFPIKKILLKNKTTMKIETVNKDQERGRKKGAKINTFTDFLKSKLGVEYRGSRR